MTSRPQFSIDKKVNDLEIQLRAEDELINIEHDIRLVVSERLGSLDYPDSIAEMLTEKLVAKAEGTFLWVALKLCLLEDSGESSEEGLKKMVDDGAGDLFPVYGEVLGRTPDGMRADAKTILQIVIAAARALTLTELNMAIAIRSTDASENDVQPRLQRDVRGYLLRRCGPFLRIVNSTVHLVHQTAKEFLVQLAAESFWFVDLTASHLLATRICIWYLQFRDFELDPSRLTEHDAIHKKTVHLLLGDDPDKFETLSVPNLMEQDAVDLYCAGYKFLAYAAIHWYGHFRSSQSQAEEGTVRKATELLDTRTPWGATWFRLAWGVRTCLAPPSGFQAPLAASYYAHHVVVKRLMVLPNTYPHVTDRTYGRTPLLWAALGGQEAVVKLLLAHPKTDPNEKSSLEETPLRLAIMFRHHGVVNLLLDRADVDRNAGYSDGGAPLTIAAESGNEEAVRLLLADRNNQRDSKPSRSRGRSSRKLRQTKARNRVDPNLSDHIFHWTALMWAARYGNGAVVKLLLAFPDIDPNCKDIGGKTALAFAARRGHVEVVRLLLAHPKIELNGKDYAGRTALSGSGEGIR
jgi:hypothetical protein